MSWFNSKSKQHPQEFEVRRLRFLGEQDGPPERELMSDLADLFRRGQNIKTAYLAQVAYGEKSFAVALCLRSQFGLDGGLAEKVGEIFASMFGPNEHLDIIFLTEAQEPELALVCKPFFRAGEGI
jgi:SseB protein C-terminal domain